MTIQITAPVAAADASADASTLAAMTESVEESFIRAFSNHPGGVVVITGTTPDGEPVGFTATSLASLSAYPPRATFNIAQTASSWPAVAEGSLLAVHFLAKESQGLARRFAGTTSERFSGDHWYVSELGLPILREAIGVLVTRVNRQVPIDLNALIVLDIEQGHFTENHEPLLYHKRAFGTVAGPPEYVI